MRFGFGKRRRWDLEVDVVSLGSGLGGLTAAIVAHDLGRKTVVLDKSPKLGGVCAYSGGETFNPNNREMRKAGFEDSEEATRDYFDFIGAGFNEPELTDPAALEVDSCLIQTDLGPVAQGAAVVRPVVRRVQ